MKRQLLFSVLRPLVGLFFTSLPFVVKDSAASSPLWTGQMWKWLCRLQLHPGILSLGLLTNLSLPVSCPQPWLKNHYSQSELLQGLLAVCFPASWPYTALPFCWVLVTQGIAKSVLRDVGGYVVWGVPIWEPDLWKARESCVGGLIVACSIAEKLIDTSNNVVWHNSYCKYVWFWLKYISSVV